VHTHDSPPVPEWHAAVATAHLTVPARRQLAPSASPPTGVPPDASNGKRTCVTHVAAERLTIYDDTP